MAAIFDLPAGTRLGSYEIVAPLGAGGMGEVYLARDARLGRDVAIKVLPASLAASPDALARFEREARAVAALSHPNILAIYDIGSDQGRAYVVMELLEGEPCARGWTVPHRRRGRRSTSPCRSLADWPRRTTKASSTAM